MRDEVKVRKARILDDTTAPCHDGAMLYQVTTTPSSLLMSYLVRTESGRLFLIDGGDRCDAEQLLSFARRVMALPEHAVLHIDGWFLTHAHNDHIGAFIETVEHYAASVVIDCMWYNFPSLAFCEACEPGEAYILRDFNVIAAQIAPFTKVVHTGDTLEYDDVRFDILSEPDESITCKTINNTSVAIRMTVDGGRTLFLGDMGVEQGDKFLAAYGEEGVRAELVQLAHHGQSGVALSLYGIIDPKACLWCTPDWLWQNRRRADTEYGSGPWKTHTTRCYMEDLGVKRHYIHKDGIWEIPLPYCD